MKQGIVFILLVLLNVASVSAFAELRGTTVNRDDGYFISHTSLDRDGEKDLSVTWTIPELNFRYREGPITDDNTIVGLNIAQPFDIPEGDYMVRITVHNDDGNKVIYRYITTN